MTVTPLITGLGSALPARIETNQDLAARMDTSDEWIRTRTGIGSRHVASPSESTADLAVAAGREALKNAGRASVDLVIVATTTPDRDCPAVAPEVAHRLGLGVVPAFDLAAVCSGFLYALEVGRSAIQSGNASTVLVIASERFTRLLDPEDRATVAIFGDGAGAVVIETGDGGESGEIRSVLIASDGGLADLIVAQGERGGVEDPYFHMKGSEVFMHAVLRMEESVRASAAESGWDVDSYDYVVGHQANERILKAIAGRLGVTVDRISLHLAEVGNTAGASIPLALHHSYRTGALRGGERVALAAFGGGATWGAASILAPSLTAAGIAEREG